MILNEQKDFIPNSLAGKLRNIPDQWNTGWLLQLTNYIDVLAIDEYAVKIENLGGKVVLPKTAVPGIGYFAVCLDTEDNIFAIWETDDSAK